MTASLPQGKRVVSLVPSVTETLLAWGVTPVGVTRWCEHPELPQVGGTKDPDLAAVMDLEPDLVVMCEEENRRDDATALGAAGVAVHPLRIRSVADVGPELGALAARLGVADRWASPPATPLAAPLPTRDPAARAPEPARPVPRPAPPVRGPGRRAFVPIWRQAGRGGGAARFTTLNDDTYGASVLAWLGVANAYGGAAERYPVTTLAEAAATGADVVVAPSEPYPFGPRHVRELSAVAPVVLVDGQDLFWWGTRTAAALSRLAAALAVPGASPSDPTDG